MGARNLFLSPLQLIERIAALLPPPRMHQHGLAGTVPAVPGARANIANRSSGWMSGQPPIASSGS
jgi:hypothetical protein